MKTLKKFWLAVAAFVILWPVLTPVIPALAASSITQSDITGISGYSFQDGANITADMGGTSITFTDPNVYDDPPTHKTDNNYLGDPRNFVPDSTVPFCTDLPKVTTSGPLSGYNKKFYYNPDSIDYNIPYGLNIDPIPDLSATPSRGTHGSGSGTVALNAELKLGYEKPIPATATSGASQACYGVLLKVTVSNTNGAAGTEFQWNNTDIVNLNNTQQVTFLAAKDNSGNTSNTVYINPSGSNGGCNALNVIKLDSPKGNSGILFNLSDTDQYHADNVNSYAPALAPYLTKNKCYIQGHGPILLSGTYGVAAAGYANSSTVSLPPGTCEEKAAGFSLTWILCPVLDAADSLAGTITGLFEDQLSFRLDSTNLSRNHGYNSVYEAWSLFREIASGLLVIVMLIMVISQAVGGGPFDAYTVRKLLPRLVAAVILMQLSWILLVWAVGIFDDIGHGLKDLMYIPFRPGNLDSFWGLLANAGVGTGTAGLGSWVLLIGIVIAAAVALPTVLMFCFIAIASVLTGLAVLVFRKILIIMALILAPLGILVWVLPGTQRYAKLWYDNLLKALFMFPIAVAIIAAGRIFAYVVGTQGNGRFLNFFLVMVGYFGPLFILPKTFKWGGQVMQMAGNAAFKASSKLQERPNKYFKARQEDLTNERQRRSKERFYNREPFNPMRPWRYPLDMFRSGTWDPLLGMPRMRGGQGVRIPGTNRRLLTERSRMRERKTDKYTESGLASLQEDQEAANKQVAINEKRLNQSSFANGGYNKDYYHQDQLRGSLGQYHARGYYDRDLARHLANGGTREDFVPGYRDVYGRMMPFDQHPSRLLQNAEFRRINELGADTMFQEALRYINQERASGDPERMANAEKLLDDNKDIVLDKYQHVLKGIYSTVDLDTFGGMHGAGGADLSARVLLDMNTGYDEGATGTYITAARALDKWLQNGEAEMTDPTHRNSVNQGLRRVFKLLSTDNPREIAQLTESTDNQGRATGINNTRRAREYLGTDTQGNPIVDPQIPRLGIRHLPEVVYRPEVIAALPSRGTTPEEVDELTALRDSILARRRRLDGLLDVGGGYTDIRAGGGRPPAGGSRDDGGGDDGGGDDGGSNEPRPHAERDLSAGREGTYPGRPPEDRTLGYDQREIYSRETPTNRPVQKSQESSIPSSETTPSTQSSNPLIPPEGHTETAASPVNANYYGEESGSYDSTPPQNNTTTRERVVREVSPTVVSPTNTTVIREVPQGESQTVYDRTPQTETSAARVSPLDQRMGEELDYQLRNVYRELKKLGARNQQQQQQFETLRSQHPDWDNDDNTQQ